MKWHRITQKKKEYERQLRLERYQKNRLLARPKTNAFHITFLAVLFFVIIIALCMILLQIDNLLIKAISITISLSIFAELYLRFLGLKIVECYQHYAREDTRRRCLCIPSCSEYAILCFKKYEFIFALMKIKKRLLVTCTGNVFIIDFPYNQNVFEQELDL